MGIELFVSYLAARETLQARLNATDEEIAMWSYIGRNDGGLDVYERPTTTNPIIKHHFTELVGIGSWFLRSELDKFQPTDNRRYLTKIQLCDRWGKKGLSEDSLDAMVRNLIESEELEPINPIRGYSELLIADGETFVSNTTLFPINQIKSIEALEFPVVGSTAKQNDSSTWAKKSSLVAAFGQYGLTEKKINNGGTKWIKEARRRPGRGGKGRSNEPEFCPFAIMKGLVNKSRSKNLSERRGWDILERSFPLAYEMYTNQDPRQYD